MKMKMKMTVLAGALAMAIAGQASASIVDMATGSSDLVLNIWDTTSQTSYTVDLGVNMSSFMAGVSGTATTLQANAGVVSGHTYTADALLTSFLSTANQATTSWSITAGDTLGSGFQGKNYMTTSTGTSMTLSNTVVQSGGTNAQSFFSALSTVSGTNPDAIGSGSTYAGAPLAAGGGYGTKWTNISSSIGSSMNFLYMTPSSTSTVAGAAVAAFKNADGTTATWTLASNGNLTYTVAAVPEPGEWLLMLSGLALIGFIATRRKDTGSMNFA